jgi:hypothetical protein
MVRSWILAIAILTTGCEQRDVAQDAKCRADGATMRAEDARRKNEKLQKQIADMATPRGEITAAEIERDVAAARYKREHQTQADKDNEAAQAFADETGMEGILPCEAALPQ